MTTEIQKKEVPKAVQLFQSESVQKKFNDLLGSKSKGFITSVMSAMSSNTNLAKCDPNSVYMAAMMAAALDLPVNQNLGFAYIIPYKKKDDNGNFIDVAQFQIGVKGLTQLAQRSGQFKTISSTPVYEGQLKEQDPLKGFEFDWSAKVSDKVIGYAAYFSLLNGFEKTLYMSAEQVQKHGKKYSKTFGSQYGTWATDFDAMAQKTVLKQLLSKYAPLSIEMQKATVADQAVINDAETMDVTYADSTEEVTVVEEETESSRFLALIQSCDTLDKLNKQRKHLAKFPEHHQAWLDIETKLEGKNV